MAKSKARTYSRYTLHALQHLGLIVRAARTEKKMTTTELANRVGISRGLLHRIEKGDPRVELGAAFEAAAVVGISLFQSDLAGLSDRNKAVAEKLALLPKAVRKPAPEVADDF